MSPHQATLGAGTVKFRPMRSGALTGFSPLMVVRFQAFGWRPCSSAARIRAPDPVEPAADPLGRQAGPDASYAGVALAGGVDPADPGGEIDVGQVAVADRPAPPGVVPGAGHLQFGAHEVDGVLVVLGPVRDRSEDHRWPFANQAATFFANSASMRARVISLRRRSSSARSSSSSGRVDSSPSSRAFFTHFPNVISCTPILRAISAIESPESSTNLTACCLYSSVNRRRVDPITVPPLC